MTACTSPERTVRSMPLRISLPATPARRPLDLEHVLELTSFDHHLDLAVDDPRLVDRHRPGGRQRRRARRSRARRRCRASSTRSCSSSAVDLALGQRDVLVAAAVADGVDVVADAHERDRRGRRPRPAGPCPSWRSSSGADALDAPSGQHRRELGGDRRVELRAQAVGRAAGRTPRRRSRRRSAARRPGWARRGSRGRSAAPRRSGPTVEAWLQCTSLFSIWRFGTDSAQASSESLMLRFVWKALVPRASFADPDQAGVDGPGAVARPRP